MSENINHKNYVFELENRGEALVTIWESGEATIAFRDPNWRSWSPPTQVTRVEEITGEGWHEITTTN